MNILLTYDFIYFDKNRGKEFCQRLDFIYKILKYLDVNILIDDVKFDKRNISSKEEIITLNKLNEKDKDYIKKYLENIDLLVAYEISHETKEIFDELKIKYIDFWVSPIRFCQDFMFEVYSNDKKINKKIKNYQIKESKIFKRAQKIQNQSMCFDRFDMEIEDNSALLIGQLFKDRAVLKKNKFLSLIDFYAEVVAISKKYKKIYFLKHPLMNTNEISFIVEKFKTIRNLSYIEDVNVYKLLSMNQIKSVYGISSSVLIESKYFNKTVNFFYKSVIDKRYTRVFKTYYKSKFWKELLNIQSEKEDIKYLVDDNYLRYKYNAFFAYKDFVEEQNKDKTSIVYNQFIKFYNFLDNLPIDKKYILYGYGTIGKMIYPLLKDKIVGIIDKSIDRSYIMIDNFEVLVLKIDDLKKNDNVIITPFLYNRTIKEQITKYDCNIIELDNEIY